MVSGMYRLPKAPVKCLKSSPRPLCDVDKPHMGGICETEVCAEQKREK